MKTKGGPFELQLVFLSSAPMYLLGVFCSFSRPASFVCTCVCAPAHVCTHAITMGTSNMILTTTSDRNGQILEILEFIANSISNNQENNLLKNQSRVVFPNTSPLPSARHLPHGADSLAVSFSIPRWTQKACLLLPGISNPHHYAKWLNEQVK